MGLSTENIQTFLLLSIEVKKKKKSNNSQKDKSEHISVQIIPAKVKEYFIKLLYEEKGNNGIDNHIECLPCGTKYAQLFLYFPHY